MKFRINVFAWLLLAFLGSCSSDEMDEILEENPVAENPTAFQLIGEVETSVDGATISWTTSEDPQGGAIFYRIYLNGELLEDNYTATSYTFSGLAADTEYEVRVQAVDEDGNTSEFSVIFQTNPFNPTRFELMAEISTTFDRNLSPIAKAIRLENGNFVILSSGSFVDNSGGNILTNRFLMIAGFDANGNLLYQRYHQTDSFPHAASSMHFFTRRLDLYDAVVDLDGNIRAVGLSKIYPTISSSNDNPNTFYGKNCPFVMTLNPNNGDLISKDIAPLARPFDEYETAPSFFYQKAVVFDNDYVYQTSDNRILKSGNSGGQWSVSKEYSFPNDDYKIKGNLLYFTDRSRLKTVTPSGTVSTVFATPNGYDILDFDFRNDEGIYFLNDVFSNPVQLRLYKEGQITEQILSFTDTQSVITSFDDQALVYDFPLNSSQGSRRITKVDSMLGKLYDNTESYAVPSQFYIKMMELEPFHYVSIGLTQGNQVTFQFFRDSE